MFPELQISSILRFLQSCWYVGELVSSIVEDIHWSPSAGNDVANHLAEMKTNIGFIPTN